MSLPQYAPKPVDPIQDEKQRLGLVVKDIPLRIGVHAGKGGVGKTFLATQLALTLAAHGLQVGLIDADVDCPNVPDALNLQADMRVTETGKLMPILDGNVKIVSTGFMQDKGAPIIIRGPIKHRLLTDFIEKTQWGSLDALIFDFPPGTSDVPLSAMQVANLTGIFILTTPQKSSLGDAKRAIAMAKKLGTPIYGLIENMSGEIFGEGTGKQLAKETDIRFICSIPLDASLRKKAETGQLALSKETQQHILSTLRIV